MAAEQDAAEQDAAEVVRARLPEQPGGPQLLALAAAHDEHELELVGGAVRDLLLGRAPRELDVVVQGDAIALAQTLAAQLASEATVHERFGTALVQAGEVRFDFAMRRAESYPAPGALPEVRAGSASEDLQRRDFTVNALALALNGPRRWQLRSVPHACADLRARQLRVLHEQSFIDDPTRLLRLARYRVRLDFAAEAHTAELAHAAVRMGALSTVSGARIGAELRLALEEPQAVAALQAMHELGLLAALHPRLRHDPALAGRALELLPRDGNRAALLLAMLLLPLTLKADGHPEAEAQALLDRLEFPAGLRDLALRTALEAVRLAGELDTRARDVDRDRADLRSADLYRAVDTSPPEGVALAGALGGESTAQAAQRWLMELRHVRLQITGEDLLAAGVPQGPEVGRRLRETLLRRLNGELAEGREAELRTALGNQGEGAARMDEQAPRA
jgi:tRNA nucleotidyltransferase (CCA-adding enzyme)